MQLEDIIKQKLEESLDIQFMELKNESFKHQGHAGDDGSGQTHFKLKVVSSDFVGYTRIQRQRVVLNVLKDCFSQGLHAISMTLEDF